MNQRHIPTCQIGHWEPLHSGCPMCGPDGPCLDPEYEAIIQQNLADKRFRRVLALVSFAVLLLAAIEASL